MTLDDKGQMKHLREGTNGWTCMPDTPTSPGPDPMCLDANGMEWAGAWLSHKAPPTGKMGFGFMLAGGSDASNYAGYPTTAADTSKPYVMFPATPYAHLMIPVK